ncbi:MULTISPECIES: LysR family transcriptional regulator [Rhizobium/Agrobacterium group]|jgi:DNA-binding transcriptional LysR family regulator|uniref:LysR family transcriptional regulator n=1 Tax=Rhizobium/Agrobacterium group TaxID=227290 RepID=UPI000629F3DA|nr:MULTISPECIES: LysR family transcriptional regulator [Rhizobium/Agrobacterium group]KKX23967.1 LysR family transcriptional regulator [Rhizobium sp. LC145]KNY30814.1 LysR family transcriptional regulator [Agrobacterium sp. SUL3]
MEIRTLRAFVEVVRQGGFSQAAKTIFSTQSTVSKAVRQLEDEIGTRLLDRIGHRSTLTVAGEVVYRRAVRILAERESLMAELDDLRGLKRGTLRLGLPPIGSSTLFAPLFAIYRNRHPSIDIRLAEHGSDRLEEILHVGEIDLAASLLPVSDEFEWQEVRREPLVALLQTDHALAAKASITLAELKDQPFLLFESGFALNRIIVDACRRAGVEPSVAARSSQIDFIVELAAAGLGIAFLPRMIAEQRSHPAVRHVTLVDPGTEWHIAMIWRRGAYLSHAAKAWLALTREFHSGD